MSDELQKNIRCIKGIGEKRATAFEKAGVRSIEDLLTFYPIRYENWQNTVFADRETEEPAAVEAEITEKHPDVRIPGGMLLSKLKADDGKNIFSIIFFNNPYAAKKLNIGEKYIFYGKIYKTGRGETTMFSPETGSAAVSKKIHAVYRQNAKLNSSTVSKAIKTALEEFLPALKDALPEQQLKKYRLMPYAQAIRAMHLPRSETELKAAKRRLVYQELLLLQLGILSSGSKNTQPAAYAVKKDYTDEFFSMLPFKPTNAQRRAVSECMLDMNGKYAMRRLLQGDVGSGKTAAAAALIYSTAKNGYQCAVMAPTEVLAKQHKQTFDSFFSGSGIKTALLTGSTASGTKKLIKEKLISGEVQVLIGTHAVIAKDTVFKNLALAITDEQHRFGVNQRAALRLKGNNPHILVMSATPIPRTLSLIIYGDLDISVLDEKPAGRKDIKTYAVPSVYHERLYAFIKKQVNSGRQCYIVCPAVDESENGFSEKKSAEEYAELLSSSVFKDIRTAVLHGRMPPGQKEKIMNAFRNGETDVLICTVVIEVGTDVPNASVMVIENAEYFGLSQLHQLRGRVGRNQNEAYCILVSDSKNDAASNRFGIMCATNDGFKIAEADLKLRGPGDFFGSRQSGLPRLKLSSLITDTAILYTARSEAQKILSDDPELIKKENALLKKNTADLFSDIS